MRIVRAALPALALLLAGSVLLPGCPKAPAESPARLAPHSPSAEPGSGILAFALISPGIYRGGQPDEAGFAELQTLGVKTVIDLRKDHDETELARRHGMEVVAIPMAGGKQAPAPEQDQVAKFLETVSDPARRPVFVHCSHGKDRTGTLIAVFRMEKEGWTNERALAEMRTFGFGDDHPRLLEYVRTYVPKAAAAK